MPSVRWPASAGHVVHAVFPRAYRPSPFPAEVLLRTRLARRLSDQRVTSLPVAKQAIISAPRATANKPNQSISDSVGDGGQSDSRAQSGRSPRFPSAIVRPAIMSKPKQVIASLRRSRHCARCPVIVSTLKLEGGAGCVSSARWDVCGGRGAILVATATSNAYNIRRSRLVLTSQNALSLKLYGS